MKKIVATALFGLMASLTVSASATEYIRYMKSGEVLRKGDSLTSPNNLYRLIMQDDGNLVLYFFPIPNSSYVRWSTSTRGSGDYASMQYDGNFAVYTSGNAWAWQAGAGGRTASNYRIYLEDDGHLYLTDSQGTSNGQGGVSYKDLNFDSCPSVPAGTFLLGGPGTPSYSQRGAGSAVGSVAAICGPIAVEKAQSQGLKLLGFYYIRP